MRNPERVTPNERCGQGAAPRKAVQKCRIRALWARDSTGHRKKGRGARLSIGVIPVTRLPLFLCGREGRPRRTRRGRPAYNHQQLFCHPPPACERVETEHAEQHCQEPRAAVVSHRHRRCTTGTGRAARVGAIDEPVEIVVEPIAAGEVTSLVFKRCGGRRNGGCPGRGAGVRWGVRRRRGGRSARSGRLRRCECRSGAWSVCRAGSWCGCWGVGWRVRGGRCRCLSWRFGWCVAWREGGCGCWGVGWGEGRCFGRSFGRRLSGGWSARRCVRRRLGRGLRRRVRRRHALEVISVRLTLAHGANRERVNVPVETRPP